MSFAGNGRRILLSPSFLSWFSVGSSTRNLVNRRRGGLGVNSVGTTTVLPGSTETSPPSTDCSLNSALGQASADTVTLMREGTCVLMRALHSEPS